MTTILLSLLLSAPVPAASDAAYERRQADAAAKALLASEASSPHASPALLDALRRAAAADEIMDVREGKYIFVRPEDLAGDLKLLRRRRAGLADAPPLADCYRFPGRETINDMLLFNRAYRGRLQQRIDLELWNQWELHETAVEADRLYQVWDLVRDSRCEYYFVTVRRQALKRLREIVGDAAYYNGALPPHVPVWAMRRID